MTAYSWMTFSQAKSDLALRLSDSSKIRWVDGELGMYICEALRTWNSLTSGWIQEYTIASTSPGWLTTNQNNSPRFQQVTDSYLFQVLQYHLLEPSSGLTWTGTSQFTIADIVGAAQRRRDELIQSSGCNYSIQNVSTAQGVSRVVLPDTFLDVQRVRWVPSIGSPVTLVRDDTASNQYFDPSASSMTTWMVSGEPPLSLNVDSPTPVIGNMECVSLQSGANLGQATPTVLGVPDDFYWVVKWGALADLLGKESEATDRARASYCLKRFEDGKKLLAKTPWIIQAKVGGTPVDTPSLSEMDSYSPEWDTSTTDSNAVVVTAGIDLLSYAGTSSTSLTLSLLGNMAIPSVGTDYVQISRDAYDSILDYAQFLATFKDGGEEFAQAMALEQKFIRAAAAENDRLLHLGIYTDVLMTQGSRQSRFNERFGAQNKEQ